MLLPPCPHPVQATQQGGVGRPPNMAPSVPSEPLTTDPRTLSAAEGGSRVVGGPVQQYAQPPAVHYAPVLQRPLQRPAPPSLSLDQRARPSVPPARAPIRSASLFTLPSLISPVQPQRQRTVLPPTSRGHTFALSSTPARLQQLPKPPSLNRPPQRFPVSNFQLVTLPLPKAPPPSGRGTSTPVQQRANPAPTPVVVQPTNPAPQLEVAIFKCPKPVTRAPPRSMEVPVVTPSEPATNQVDLLHEQQMRKEREPQVAAEVAVTVTEQPSVPAGDSSEVEVVPEAVNTVQQVEAQDIAPPQPPPEESDHESFMDFTADTTRDQHEVD